jgi:hypothetical protein
MQQGADRVGLRAAVWFIGLALTVGSVQSVVAADPPAKKTARKGVAKGNPNLLTREQLRACMDDEDRVRQGAAKVKLDEASLESTRAEVERIDEDIARRLAALDPADTTTRQALSEEENRRNELADGYNARLRALREEAAQLTAQRNAWAQRCTNKDYDERDEIAIKRERQRAAGGSR